MKPNFPPPFTPLPETPGRHCDLCRGADFELVSRLDRRGRPLETCICVACGLVGHRYLPDESELANYYRREYRERYHGEHRPSAKRALRAWRQAERLHRRLGAYLAPEDRVLEVGAGLGATVKFLELRGLEASGIEPNEGFCQFAAQELRADVHPLGLFDLLQEGAYDFVLLVHVIEHFASPRAALEHIHRLLRPGGRLYVECPNLATPFAPPGRLFHYAHLHNFTPGTLSLMARHCGFDVETWFDSDGSGNLKALLRRTEEFDHRLDRQGYHQAAAAIGGYSMLGHHVRWRYLQSRIERVASYCTEWFTAKRRIEEFLEQCRAERPQRQVLPFPAEEVSTDQSRRSRAA